MASRFNRTSEGSVLPCLTKIKAVTRLPPTMAYAI